MSRNPDHRIVLEVEMHTHDYCNLLSAAIVNGVPPDQFAAFAIHKGIEAIRAENKVAKAKQTKPYFLVRSNT